MNMKVILLKDLENIGKRYEVKEVAEGFAVYYLLPRKLAKIATPENLEWLRRKLERERKASLDQLEEARELAEKLSKTTVSLTAKVNEEGKLFGAIKAMDIALALKEQGINIHRKQILLEKPIKEAGEFEVKVDLGEGIQSAFKVIITPES